MTTKRGLNTVTSLFVLVTLTACGGGGGGGGATPVGPATAPQTGLVALPQTGQTTCFNAAGAGIPCDGTGQDGALKTGVVAPSPRFTVGTGANASCVTDNLTGLTWVNDANLPASPKNWAEALAIVDSFNSLRPCGFTNWRLPNRNELGSLIDYGLENYAIALNTRGFNNVQLDLYWSSTNDIASGGTSAWTVNMFDGGMRISKKSNIHYVWPCAGQ